MYAILKAHKTYQGVNSINTKNNIKEQTKNEESSKEQQLDYKIIFRQQQRL